MTGDQEGERVSDQMPDVDPNWQLSLLKRSLVQLAKSPQEQLDAFVPLTSVADELVDDFFNAYLLVGQLLENHLVDLALVARLNQIMAAVDDIQRQSPTSEVWTTRGLVHSPAWEELRVAAREVLAQMP